MLSPDVSSTILNRYDNNASHIIQILNDLQEFHGYLPKDDLKKISNELNLPMSKIWGIITFYSHYKMKPPAANTVRICTGTACHVKNSKMLKETFEEQMNVENDELYTTETVACLGCCALAPVFEINGKVHGKLDTSKVKKLANKIKGDQIEQ